MATYDYWLTTNTTITTGGTPVESGHYSTYVPSRAFDGNYTNYWQASTTGAGSWIGYHFATAQTIAHLYYETGTANNRATGIAFEWSNNGSDWTEHSFANGDATTDMNTGEAWYLSIAEPVSATYYRIRCLGVATATYWRVDEIEMHSGVKYTLEENLCTGGTAVSGGAYSGYPATNAFNADWETSWYSSQSGTGVSGVSYLGYHFATAVKPDIILVAPMYWITETPASVILQSSNNGTDWTSVKTYNRGTDWQYGAYSIMTGNYDGVYTGLLVPEEASAATYWRLLANANLATGDYWGIQELALTNFVSENTFYSYVITDM